MEKLRYYEFRFSNGEIFHAKEKDIDKFLSKNPNKIMTWEDYKPFTIKVKSKPFDYDLSKAEITLKEVK